MKLDEKNIDEAVRQCWPSASQEEADSSCNTVLHYLRVSVDHAPKQRPTSLVWSGSRVVLLSSAAAVLFAVFLWVIFRPSVAPEGTFAVVESADVYRVVDGKTQGIPIGEKIEVGQTIRTTGATSGVLKLADGSSVEMRAHSELFLQSAADGVRINLSSGGVIVNAVKQITGRHLYVQTKDVTVSVVGTVFLVNAEEEGSRVAVIQGEVRVRQGEEETKLRPGEQVISNPEMESSTVKEELKWSREAVEHVALLQQSAVPTVTRALREPAAAFELASIRPSPPNSAPGDLNTGPGRSPCNSNGPRIDPSRFVTNNKSVYTLIVWAYGKNCDLSIFDLISGGPGWIRSDAFDIEALIPAGSPNYTKQQFFVGGAPQLQMMLQNLLEKRFKLALHRDAKEVSAYELVLGKSAPKLKRSLTDDPIRNRLGRDTGKNSMNLVGGKATMAELARLLGLATGRPVLDRTGIMGEFNFNIEYVPVGNQFGAAPSPEGDMAGPSLFSALDEQLGLKLEAKKVLMEVLVIDHVDKPSEN